MYVFLCTDLFAENLIRCIWAFQNGMPFTFKLTDVLHYTFRHSKTLWLAQHKCYVLYLMFQNRTEVTSTFNEYSDILDDNAI
jgi:hypothetical protein